jgi:membrane protein YqaA with SNARE-associated domain
LLTDTPAITISATDVPDVRARPLPGVRAWFAVFLVWMSGLALAAATCFKAYEGGLAWALPAGILALMCFYLSLCNSLVPLPTAWIILLAAAPDYTLIETGWLRVLVVALLGTISTVVANLTEYHLLGRLFGTRVGERLRRTKLYGWALRWFDRAPFQLLALIAFIPLPIDAVRWLAILRRYPRVQFALAYFVGRGPRYLLFAWCSVLLRLTGPQILLIQIALVVFALLGRVAWRLRRRAMIAVEGEQTTLAEATDAESD